MGKEVLREAKIEVAGKNLSDHCSAVAIEDSADEVDCTGMGSGYREFLQGMKDATITATFANDFATGSVIDTLAPLYEKNEAGTVKVWPTSGGTICYTMVAKLYNKPSFGGALGELSSVDITFKNAGTAGITRGTS